MVVYLPGMCEAVIQSPTLKEGGAGGKQKTKTTGQI